ncbi:hypothetical protein HMPREF0971_01371 [Segatella oris F0302]|uniref:Uncharacterized protein n=1 Tax=Segatella oris F0302 TaxID=649760 RepID=D1QQW9_9BACT|nr:hypothetical protein HMPREF0971_01371 [Segatella oris F0302]
MNTTSILLQNWTIQLQRLSLMGERRFSLILSYRINQSLCCII